MLADARGIPHGSALETDVCIVGAGPAGITLARELGRVGRRVVILESGGLHRDPRSQALDEGTSTGLPYPRLDAARLRCFGGASNHWDGLARPLDPVDFEPRSGVPLSGWPIRRADLDPYYARARTAIGLPRLEGHEALRPLPLAGAGLVTRVAEQVPEENRSFERFASEVRAARHVSAYLHANVMEVVTDDSGRAAARVRVATFGGNRFTVAARQFVLAAGGIETVRLLLVSDRRQPRGLGNAHDLVGRCFLEHPRWVGGRLVPTDRHVRTGFYDLHRVGRTMVKGYLGLSEAVKRSQGLLDVQISLAPTLADSYERARGSEDAASARAVRDRRSDSLGRDVANVAGDLMTWQTYTIPGAPLPVPYPEVADELARGTAARREQLLPVLLGDLAGEAVRKAGRAPVSSIDLITRVEPVPNRDSRITLSDERDELGMRRVRLDWRLSPADKRGAIQALELLASEAGRRGVGRVRLETSADDAAWPADLAVAWHHMGTTRMSGDPRHGVVDADCRVHGMSNLYVAGSSVFPTAGGGTPTLTLVALAIRLADHLARGRP